MNNQIEIIDDFLPLNEFCQLFDVIMNQFEWGWVDGIATLDDGHFQLVHGMYINNVPTSKFFQILSPIYDREQIVSTFRIKANLTPRTEKLKVFTDAFLQVCLQLQFIYYKYTMHSGKKLMKI